MIAPQQLVGQYLSSISLKRLKITKYNQKFKFWHKQPCKYINGIQLTLFDLEQETSKRVLLYPNIFECIKLLYKDYKWIPQPTKEPQRIPSVDVGYSWNMSLCFSSQQNQIDDYKEMLFDHFGVIEKSIKLDIKHDERRRKTVYPSLQFTFSRDDILHILKKYLCNLPDIINKNIAEYVQNRPPHILTIYAPHYSAYIEMGAAACGNEIDIEWDIIEIYNITEVNVSEQGVLQITNDEKTSLGFDQCNEGISLCSDTIVKYKTDINGIEYIKVAINYKTSLLPYLESNIKFINDGKHILKVSTHEERDRFMKTYGKKDAVDPIGIGRPMFIPNWDLLVKDWSGIYLTEYLSGPCYGMDMGNGFEIWGSQVFYIWNMSLLPEVLVYDIENVTFEWR